MAVTGQLKLHPSGKRVTYSSFFGGTAGNGMSINVDKDQRI
jgi:hypothetical protein